MSDTIKIKLDVGGMWDTSPIEIRRDEEVWLSWAVEPCPHCGPPYKKEGSDSTFVRCPAVVVAENEGGFASTGVCVLCVVEAAKREGII